MGRPCLWLGISYLILLLEWDIIIQISAAAGRS